MYTRKISRRAALSGLAMGTALAGLPLQACAAPEGNHGRQAGTKYRYCLNTSTISGQSPGIRKYVEIAAEAGYDGIEVWIRDLEQFLEEGGRLADLRGQVESSGIRVESAIGFAPWIGGGEEGFAQMEREMNLLSELGCRRIAAPPAGLPANEPLDLFRVGKRYGELLELGRKTGVMPQLEFWGASPVLWHLGQVLMIAAVANDADTRILPDVYHLHRGGSGFNALELLSGAVIDIFHMNDYPAHFAPDELSDADRVYPGEGSAPFERIMQGLSSMGGELVLSLELFNRSYWEQDMLEVARTGLQKMKEIS